jgi:hypothetical protein
MSGLTAFPKAHWTTLGPAMRGQAALHAKVAGHTPRGPLKHFWGESSRYAGDDNPYSLFLALGIPFEVTEKPAADGLTFLADADVDVADAARPLKIGTRLVARPRPGLPEGVRGVAETLPALWALKRELVPTLDRVPYVEEETPVVCAWYPTARSVLLWNLSERRETLTLRDRDNRRRLTL